MFVRIFVVVGLAILIWSAYARPSGAHGAKEIYTVKAYDTLWSIAQSHYAGDPREAIWEIQERNDLAGAAVRPGQRLVLP
jgi:LysM repeat protein